MVTPHNKENSNPMLPGMSKDQIAKMNEIKQMTSALGGEIIADFKEGTITLKFIASDPKLIPIRDNFIDQFPSQIAAQLDMFFGIKGSITKRNRNAAKP